MVGQLGEPLDLLVADQLEELLARLHHRAEAGALRCDDAGGRRDDAGVRDPHLELALLRAASSSLAAAAWAAGAPACTVSTL
jgi:hypothetical protein